MTPQTLTTYIKRLLPSLSPRSQALWAADCAERVLPVFEARFPQDQRPREAIAAARRGDKDAAYAAYAAAIAAARRGDKDAANAADAAACAARAAYAAAIAAARRGDKDAANAAYAAHAAYATYAAAYAADAAAPDQQAERVWQLERLMYYLHPEQDADQHWASVCALILEN